MTPRVAGAAVEGSDDVAGFQDGLDRVLRADLEPLPGDSDCEVDGILSLAGFGEVMQELPGGLGGARITEA